MIRKTSPLAYVRNVKNRFFYMTWFLLLSGKTCKAGVSVFKNIQNSSHFVPHISSPDIIGTYNITRLTTQSGSQKLVWARCHCC